MAKQPQVLWAQREGLLYVTIEVDEAKIEELKGEGNKLHFAGSSKSEKYETTLEFFDEIDAESVQRIGSSTRVVELVVKKKTPAWWPRLLSVKGKVHWLKVDFGKWKDEDEDDEVEEASMGGGMSNGFDLNQYMSSLGGAGGGADFDGLDEEEDDMPDLEDNDEDEEPAEIKA